MVQTSAVNAIAKSSALVCYCSNPLEELLDGDSSVLHVVQTLPRLPDVCKRGTCLKHLVTCG